MFPGLFLFFDDCLARLAIQIAVIKGIVQIVVIRTRGTQVQRGVVQIESKDMFVFAPYSAAEPISITVARKSAKSLEVFIFFSFRWQKGGAVSTPFWIYLNFSVLL